ncbi:hypothetical protein OG417_43610 [Actinoallomurus sp. NBC_01490]|jgi:hypothetical protein|uniref:hypothetical protein n=1 Tax=Actinoallomurus sp. NBC_01490 TaxID=2903557 RepID=UPI002E30AFC0|nr:hypothetical protein [Actinoallomurus sp. NBC_01490]
MMILAVNEDQVTPGVGAFLIVAALGVTLFFLIRSMNKRIARIEAPSEDDLRQAEWERRQADRDSGDQGGKAAAGVKKKAESRSEGDQPDA